MAKMQTAAPAAPVMDEAELAEMRRLIFDAPSQSWRRARVFPLTRR